MQKRRLQFSVGSRGSEPGCFTWPRGIAVGPDNTMVVADSSNHRVQVRLFKHQLIKFSNIFHYNHVLTNKYLRILNRYGTLLKYSLKTVNSTEYKIHFYEKVDINMQI